MLIVISENYYGFTITGSIERASYNSIQKLMSYKMQKPVFHIKIIQMVLVLLHCLPYTVL